MNFRSNNKLRAARRRRLAVESLESRQLLASLPTGALPDDTGEYMLGDIVVTVVLMESTSTMAPNDVSTENWTPATIQAVKNKVEAGFAWWKEVLAARSPTMAADLNFYPDYTYANTPVPTGYEPINRISNDFFIAAPGGSGWMYDFLRKVGYSQTGDFSQDLRAFNNAQRTAGTAAHPGPADWAFTIFVVNSTSDGDDSFASGGSFTRAFSYPGGRMMIVPSDRPDYTYTHEMAHQFWGLDEYLGNNYLARRGYYNSPNSNAARLGYDQQTSIMTNGDLMLDAFNFHQQDSSALEMIGWRDSDSDGIFDVLDVPFELTGNGYYDSATGKYRFRGTSRVQTLPNLNSFGVQSDITINEITRAEYRIDGGAWQTAATFSAPSVTLDLALSVPPTANTVEIRTIDAVIPGSGGTGASSPIFLASLTRPEATASPGINGFVWNDADSDATFDMSESGLAGWTVQLVSSGGQLLPIWSTYDADSYTPGAVLNSANPAVTLSAIGGGTDGTVTSLNSSLNSTPGRVFGVQDAFLSSFTTSWNTDDRNLRARFTVPVNRVSLDAIGNSAGDIGRLEAYDANDNLLARFTTTGLSSGEIQTMTIERPTADIAYVIAKSHAGTDILLDNLRYGAQNSVTTGAAGEYSLDYLPAGTYTVKVTPPASFVSDGPLPGNRTVTIAAGETKTHVDFAARRTPNAWQNPRNPNDVDNDTFVAPLDALQVINDLNINGSRQLPTQNVGPQSPPPYLDVSGDGFVAPLDALLVINALNSQGNSEGQDASTAGTPAAAPNAGPNGEDLMQIARNATANSALNPLRRFAARGRLSAASLEALLPTTSTTNGASSNANDSIDDQLALDVYRAWTRQRDAAVDLEEHDHYHDDEEADADDHDHLSGI